MTTDTMCLLMIQTILILGGYWLITKLEKIISLLTEIERSKEAE